MLYAKGGAALVLMEAVSVETQKSRPAPAPERRQSHRRLQGAGRAGPRRDRRQDRSADPALHEDRPLRLPPEGGGPGLRLHQDACPSCGPTPPTGRAKRGMDAVELHFAHAYTLASFLSRYNKRKDEYGGAKLENRMRLMSEIIAGRARGRGQRLLPRLPHQRRRVHPGRQHPAPLPARSPLRCAELGLDYISVSAGGKFEDAVPHRGRSRSIPTPATRAPAACRPPGCRSGSTSTWPPTSRRTLTPRATPSPSSAPAACPPRRWPKTSLQKRRRRPRSVSARPILCDPYWPNKYKEGREQRHAQVHVLQLLPGDGRRLRRRWSASSGRKKAYRRP